MFLFAYFVNMIIDAEFLALFYVFTQIIVIPDFTSKIYHQILQIVFSTETLIEYFSDLSKVPLKILEIDI